MKLLRRCCAGVFRAIAELTARLQVKEYERFVHDKLEKELELVVKARDDIYDDISE